MGVATVILVIGNYTCGGYVHKPPQGSVFAQVFGSIWVSWSSSSRWWNFKVRCSDFDFEDPPLRNKELTHMIYLFSSIHSGRKKFPVKLIFWIVLKEDTQNILKIQKYCSKSWFCTYHYQYIGPCLINKWVSLLTTR